MFPRTLLLLLLPFLLVLGGEAAPPSSYSPPSVFIVNWHKSGTIAARTFLQAWELALAKRLGTQALLDAPLHVHHHRFINDIARKGTGGKVARAYCEKCGYDMLRGGCLGARSNTSCVQCEYITVEQLGAKLTITTLMITRPSFHCIQAVFRCFAHSLGVAYISSIRTLSPKELESKLERITRSQGEGQSRPAIRWLPY